MNAENGVLLPSLEAIAPDAYAKRIERHGVIDSVADPDVADACGSLTAFGQDVALRQLAHDGVTVATTATVIAELAGEYPAYMRIMRG